MSNEETDRKAQRRERQIQRRKQAEAKENCKAHIYVKLVNGRCLTCDETYAKRKKEAQENNWCTAHKMPLDKGACSRCQDNYAKRRDSAIEKGVCPKHVKVKLENGECTACLDFRKQRRDIAKSENKCHRHLVKLINDKCPTCLDIYQERKKYSIDNDVCIQHPSIKLDGKSCYLCRDDYQKKKEYALKHGTCFYHPKVKAVTTVMCFDCWCSSLAADALGSKKFSLLIKDFYLKDGCDAFIGIKLEPGHNDFSASIDHIIPLSRGGKKTIANCQWLANIHNRSKKNRTNDEYFDEIYMIYEYWILGSKKKHR